MKDEGLKSLLMIIGVVIIASIIIPILFRLLPLILLVLVGIYFYQRGNKKKDVKWYEGSQTDSYYQKTKNEDVIDVEVKVREEKHE